MSSFSKLVDLKCPTAALKWLTPERHSQSLTSAISPSGRYIFIAYLFGINVLDTKTGNEV